MWSTTNEYLHDQLLKINKEENKKLEKTEKTSNVLFPKKLDGRQTF